MDYKLAKELKDAGFTQRRMPAFDADGYIHRSEAEKRDYAHEPDLEELIEACGEEFREMQKFPRFPLGWRAVSSRKYGTHGCQVDGSTPTEAVARLWLALNH
jgi:hypothetical protein